MTNRHAHRKDEHLFLATKFYHQPATDLDQVQLIADNLPELGVADVDMSTTLCGKPMAVPFFINAMTGGSEQTNKINERLARIAATTGVAMATGSQSIALKDPSAQAGFKQIREANPNGMMLGNLGATYDPAAITTAQQLLKADAMQLHINVAQELTMPEGDRSFLWQENIKNATTLPFPIMVKEVGFGITPRTLPKLARLGVKYVDLAGQGGTNFIQIENARRPHHDYTSWQNCGMTTAQTLIAARPWRSQFSFTASGGITSPLDVVKCLALGADNVGISNYFLHVLVKHGDAALEETITSFKHQIAALMVLFNAPTVAALRKVPTVLHGDLATFAAQI